MERCGQCVCSRYVEFEREVREHQLPTQFSIGTVGTCRDYARFGQLLLNRGAWAGLSENIVSEDYIDMMRTPQTRYDPYVNYSNPCYGLLTWLNTNPGSDRGSDTYPGV